MKKLLAMALAVLFLSNLAACKKNTELPAEITAASPKEEIIRHNTQIAPEEIRLVQLQAPHHGDTIAIIDTTAGTLYVVLYPEHAPKTIEQFTTRVEKKDYSNTPFSPVMKNFYVEAEFPASTLAEEPTAVEPNINLWALRGAVGVRHTETEEPENDLNRIFIIQAETLAEELFAKMAEIGYPEKVLNAYREYGGIPGYDTQYTIIGQVYSGYDVLDKIASAPVDDTYTPKKEIKITKIRLERFDEDQPIPPQDEWTTLNYNYETQQAGE